VAENFLVRRTAGNALEALGVVAFRLSGVGAGGSGGLVRCRTAPDSGSPTLLKPRACSTKTRSSRASTRSSDGLERSSSRLASTINTPPLDVPGRQEWQALRDDIGSIPPDNLPLAKPSARCGASSGTNPYGSSDRCSSSDDDVDVGGCRCLTTFVGCRHPRSVLPLERVKCSPQRCSITTGRRSRHQGGRVSDV
jgi:hypothetical protein